ncbi:MAG: PEP-CTERM sorting domain-containing protein [Phycisphaerales bacterium]
MKTKITVITAILLLASTSALATTIYGTVTASYTGFGAADSMTIWGGGLTSHNLSAGALLLNKTAGTGDGQYLDNGTVGVFCIDLLETAASSSKKYDVLMPQDGPRPTSFLGGGMGEAKADYLAELWGRYYDSAWSTSGTHSTAQKEAAGAFAAAVWEIVYEAVPSSPTSWDVTTDNTEGDLGFRAANLNSQLANSMLHSLNGTGPMADLRALSYNGGQDFIASFSLVTIPEPATIAFAAMGLLFIARKRN